MEMYASYLYAMFNGKSKAPKQYDNSEHWYLTCFLKAKKKNM